MTRKDLGAAAAFVVFCTMSALVAWGLLQSRQSDKKSTPALPPASMGKTLKEEDINVITLTPEAVDRLALTTAPVERRPMERKRGYGGEVMVPPGQAITVAAPLSGTLKALPGGMPRAGQTVKKGQALLQLLPLLTPEGRVTLAAAKIDADGQVKSAQTQVDAAQIALDRAKRVFASDAGSRKAVDEAQAQFDLTSKSLEAASARRALLEKVVGEVEKGTAGPITVEAPESGLLRNVSALPDQSVPAGAALFEVLDLDRVWVRVPVYVGDLHEIDIGGNARITNLTARPGDKGQSAATVSAPPSASLSAGTIDLFYQLDNRTTKYSPGQRVAATLMVKGEAESLTVRWSAVLHDIHGGTWVYEQTGERQFVRRRVSVRWVADDTAVLASGPAVGVKVVTAGAAELFGAETGFSK